MNANGQVPRLDNIRLHLNRGKSVAPSSLYQDTGRVQYLNHVARFSLSIKA
jgi:hypothetical protein